MACLRAETASKEEEQHVAAAGRKRQRQQAAGGEETGGQRQPARQRQRQDDPEEINLTSKARRCACACAAAMQNGWHLQNALLSPHPAPTTRHVRIVSLQPTGNAADEILAARQRNQVLSCDLTGDDDAPQWSTVPRPVHSQD